MSRVERVENLLRQIEDETKAAFDEHTQLYEEVTKLRDENSSLRELVEAMRTYMAGTVEHCGYQTMTTGYTMLGSRLEQCEKQMKALGIEVRA